MRQRQAAGSPLQAGPPLTIVVFCLLQLLLELGNLEPAENLMSLRVLPRGGRRRPGAAKSSSPFSRSMSRESLIAALVLIVGVSVLAWAANPQDTSLPTVVSDVRAEIRPDQAMDFMRHVYSTDRWFTFPKFAETAEYLKQTMTDLGLKNVEVVNAPADGVSQFGYWT